MDNHMNHREYESAEDSYPESMYFKALHDPAQDPEQEAVDNKGEDTKSKQIDR